MSKKWISVILIIGLLVLSTSCSTKQGTQQNTVLSPVEEGEKPTITLVMSVSEYANFKAMRLDEYAEQFESDMGVEVALDIIKYSYGRMMDSEEKDAYMKELSTRLYSHSGPDLIFTEYFFFKQVIEQNAVAEVTGNIPNLNKLYKGLVKEKSYYVPIGMRYTSPGISSQMLDRLKQPVPKLDWMQQDYFALWDQWIETEKPYFNAAEYEGVYNRFIEGAQSIELREAAFSIDIPGAIEGIRKARQVIFGGSYKLEKSYRFQNYYNLLFEENSTESAGNYQLIEANRPYHLSSAYAINAFRASDTAAVSKKNSAIMLPQHSNRKAYVNTCGFLVNRNAAHPELAYEFINGLLSEKQQKKLYEEGAWYYPVSKAIEDEIMQDEKQRVSDAKILELKKYILGQLDAGSCETDIDRDARLDEIKNTMRKDLSRYILADEEYSDKALEAELRKLVDKYNIWLSE